MRIRKNSIVSTAIAVICAFAGSARPVYADDTAQSLGVLRNTVINLLEGLVQKGVLTREQAQAMVKSAEDKAAAQAKADAARKAAEAKAEQGAVRVPYVPQIIQDKIRSAVKKDLEKDVTRDVVADAKEQHWGVPGALPDWINRLDIHGDIRLRGESDMYAHGNSQQYPDFSAINAAGGIERAGANALLNTSVDRYRERARLRLDIDAHVTDALTAGVQIGYDNQSFAVSTSQTLGTYGQNTSLAVYQAYLRYDRKGGAGFPWLTLEGGRFANPFYSTALVWYPDLNFDGTYGTLRVPFGGADQKPRNVFFTVGAFPLQEIQLSYRDKWLLASQLGLDLPWSGGGRASLAAAYYDYDHITGVRNSVNSTLENFTAPPILQKGNTLYDISNNPLDPTVNLYALAADYRELEVTAGLDLPVGGHKLSLTADYVNNIGYNQQAIFARTGLQVPKRGLGYLADLGFGSAETGRAGTWDASIEYRYLQRDAVVDAFADQDFHLGGTDAKGYVLGGQWWFLDHTSLWVRYFSTNAIDGPPLGIDMIFVDVNAAF